MLELYCFTGCHIRLQLNYVNMGIIICFSINKLVLLPYKDNDLMLFCCSFVIMRVKVHFYCTSHLM